MYVFNHFLSNGFTDLINLLSHTRIISSWNSLRLQFKLLRGFQRISFKYNSYLRFFNNVRYMLLHVFVSQNVLSY